MAVDDKRVFAAVADIDVHTTVQPVPGGAPGIYALDLVSGNIVWERHFRHTGQTSSTEVDSIFSSALSVSRDVLFAANLNGEVFALRTSSGEELWRFNTAIKVTDVGGVAGNGGTIDSVGPVPAGRELYINSGYSTFGGASDWMAGPGNALFVLRLP
jgi:polyvinyl alcohol dehydrogenase (cytochrome)